ncbi:hypothetical protein FACS18948_5590 [Clostridia bacterium]|nr:hypothetical protein FACS18948_5590 [Clostridia bacterium]
MYVLSTSNGWTTQCNSAAANRKYTEVDSCLLLKNYKRALPAAARSAGGGGRKRYKYLAQDATAPDVIIAVSSSP